jgi:hypothetical protein
LAGTPLAPVLAFGLTVPEIILIYVLLGFGFNRLMAIIV